MFKWYVFGVLMMALVGCAKPEGSTDLVSSSVAGCSANYELQMVKFPDNVVRKSRMYQCGGGFPRMAGAYALFYIVSVDDESDAFKDFLTFDQANFYWKL